MSTYRLFQVPRSSVRSGRPKMRQVRMAATAGIHIRPKMQAALTVWVALISTQKMPLRQIVSN